MSQTRYFNNRLSPETWQATAVPNHYPYHIDNWLIFEGDNTVDAKRIWPLMWLYLKCVIAIGCFYLFYLIEDFSFFLFGDKFSTETRVESILETINIYIEIGKYNIFIFGIGIAAMLLVAGLWLVFHRYPSSLRFNKNIGLVYTKRWGKLWVTPWDKAHIRLWRYTNIYAAGTIVERAIAVRLFRINRKGELIERWEPIAGTDNMNLSERRLGGCPTVLFWHWLNDYMQGKTYSSETPPKRGPVTTFQKPKVGRQSFFEHLRFRNYHFPKDIDAQAEKLHQQLLQKNLYPDENSDNASLARVPDDPFFFKAYDGFAGDDGSKAWGNTLMAIGGAVMLFTGATGVGLVLGLVLLIAGTLIEIFGARSALDEWAAESFWWSSDDYWDKKRLELIADQLKLSKYLADKNHAEHEKIKGLYEKEVLSLEDLFLSFKINDFDPSNLSFEVLLPRMSEGAYELDIDLDVKYLDQDQRDDYIVNYDWVKIINPKLDFDNSQNRVLINLSNSMPSDLWRLREIKTSVRYKAPDSKEYSGDQNLYNSYSPPNGRKLLWGAE